MEKELSRNSFHHNYSNYDVMPYITSTSSYLISNMVVDTLMALSILYVSDKKKS